MREINLFGVDWSAVTTTLQAIQCPHGGWHAPGETGIRVALERLPALNSRNAAFAFLGQVLRKGHGFVDEDGILDLHVWAAVLTAEQAAVIRMICGVPADWDFLSTRERQVGLCRLAQVINAYVTLEEQR